jgi:hypothetical protein
MKKSFSFLLICFLTAWFLLPGCGTTTKVTGTWKQYPDETFDFNKLAVVGITRQAEGRRVVEEEISDLLNGSGFRALGGLDFLPPNANEENLPLEVLIQFLDSEDVDGVLTVSVLRTKDTKQHVSGSYYYYPWSEAYFGDYYGQMKNYLYAPGYSTVSTTFFLETNLYSFPEGELLWSAQTASSDVTDIRTGAKSLSKTIVNQLIKEKVLGTDD